MARRGACICIVFLLVIGCCLACIPAYAEGNDLPVTFALRICKVDDGTGLPVGGAEFRLSREDGAYLTEDRQWSKNETEAMTLVTDDTGIFMVETLTPGVYALTETKAPKGYELLAEPVRIEVVPEYARIDDGMGEVTGFAVQCEGGQVCEEPDGAWNLVEIKIENAYGTVLPATGGMGTAVFYMFGMVVLFVAALIVVAKRLIPERRV